MFGELVLDREHVRDVAVVAFRPQMRICSSVYQLRADPHSATRALDRAFKNVSDPECFADFAEVALNAVFVLHHRCAANDFEVGHFREIGQDLVLNSIGEVGILFVVAEIFKREDSNAFIRDCADDPCKYFTSHCAMAEEDRETDCKRTTGEEERRYQRPTRPTRRRNRMDWPCVLPTFSALEFFRYLRIPEAIFEKISEMKSQAMFYFALAQILQIRLPAPVFPQIVGDMFG